MSTDFQQERKWKKNASKKLSIAIHKYFKEKEVKAEQQEKEETKRMRKQATTIARDIMQFWRNVEKIIEYKQKYKSSQFTFFSNQTSSKNIKTFPFKELN